MGHGPKKVTHIFGGEDILMTSGERLLIGQPRVFTLDFKELIKHDQPIYTDNVIRRIETLSRDGFSKLYKLLQTIDGFIPVVAMPEYVLDKIRRYVDDEKLLALVLPPLEAKDTKIDPKKLGDMGPDLVGNEDVNPDIDIKNTKFKDLNDMKAKLVYVIKRSPDFIDGAKIIEAFKAALTPFVIISTAVVLAAWAASHFTGVGFAIDAVLLAIGWAMIGWGIFSALKKLLKCLKMIHDAKSIKQLDKAAEMLADAIVMLGVDTFIGLLTRGAGKLRMPAGSKKKMTGGGSGTKSKADIQADNKAKAVSSSSASKTAFKDDVHSGMHNQSDVEVPYKEYDWDKFKTRREIDMDNLSPEDMKVAKVLEAQGRSENEIVEVLSSSTGKNPMVNSVAEGDKFYGFQTEGIPKSPDNKYWLDEKAFKDVESKYFKDGAWDKEGVKNYLALPCVNSANSIVTAEAQKAGSALQTTIGRASEELPFIKGGNGVVENIAKIMPGGGTQITPDPNILKIIPTPGG